MFLSSHSGSMAHSPDRNRVTMIIDLPVLVLFNSIVVVDVASRRVFLGSRRASEDRGSKSELVKLAKSE